MTTPLIHVAFLMILSAFFALLASPSTAQRTNVLYTHYPKEGELKNGQSLVSNDHTLYMAPGCNLELYNRHILIWETGTHRAYNCSLKIYPIGLFAIAPPKLGDPLVWSSNNWSRNGNYALILKNDGRLRVYGPSIWSAMRSSTTTARDTSLPATTPESIWYSASAHTIGFALVNGHFKLVLQDDCNLVLSYMGSIYWQSGRTNNMRNCYVSLNAYGKLSVFYNSNQILWTTGVSTDYGEHALVLHSNGHLDIYGPSIWRNTATSDAITGAEVSADALMLGSSREEKIAMVTMD